MVIEIGDPVKINDRSDHYAGLIGTFGGFSFGTGEDDAKDEYGTICPVNSKFVNIQNGEAYRFLKYKFEKITIEEFVLAKLENA